MVWKKTYLIYICNKFQTWASGRPSISVTYHHEHPADQTKTHTKKGTLSSWISESFCTK